MGGKKEISQGGGKRKSLELRDFGGLGGARTGKKESLQKSAHFSEKKKLRIEKLSPPVEFGRKGKGIRNAKEEGLIS